VRLPIRVRLTGWYLGVLAVLLVAVGGFVLVRLHSSLVDEIDRSLDVRAVQIASGFRGGGEGEFRDLSDATLAGLPRGESAAQLVGAAGVLESSGDPVAARPMLPGALAREPVAGSTVRATVPLGTDHEPFRALALPVPGHPGEAIVVVTSTEQATGSVHEVWVLLIVAVPIALLLACVAGLLLARKALRPVEAMTSKARSISADHIGERIDVPRTADEISRLGITLNGMLDRLERDVVERRRFVADASHELRTPLAGMRTTLEVALDDPNTNGDARLALADALGEVERMSRTVDALLTLARLDEGVLNPSPEPVNIPDLVERVVESYRAQADGRGVSRLLTVPERRAMVAGDRGQLTLVVSNLVENAVQYTPRGGTVTVRASRESGSIRLTVTDTGIGIPPEDIAHVFDRFYRSDPARARNAGGSGLGLAISRGIVEAHGGRIWAVSELGRGSMFTVELPESPVPHSAGPEIRATAPAPGMR
jgi:heavy metal sensor kinase